MDALLNPRHFLPVLVACLVPAGATFAQSEAPPAPPGANWENYNRTLDGQRASGRAGQASL